MARLSSIITAALVLAASLAQCQGLSRLDRERGHVMLRFTEKDLIENYFDKSFHGVDIGRLFREAGGKIDQAATLGEMFRAIAGPFIGLGDAHTMFIPPARTLRLRYGWDMAMVGDSCRVTYVQPESDAQAQGVRAGDPVFSVDGIVPSRATMHLLNYTMYSLDPRVRVSLVVGQRDGTVATLKVTASAAERERVVYLSGMTGAVDFWNYELMEEPACHPHHSRLKSIGDNLIVWKLPRFDLSGREIKSAMDVVMKSGSLILDLRDNPGGYVPSLTSLAGYFFDSDVTLFHSEGRARNDSVVAPHAGVPYRGSVIVLIDSRSASSAEIFARTMQIHHRGMVLGDVSSGSVMEAMYHPRSMGASTVISYGSSISLARVRMPDGCFIEGTGVYPDERILPSQRDLALGLDPVMARATELAGAPLDPRRSGELFPPDGGK